MNKLPNHVTEVLTPWLEDADLDKLSGTGVKICEDADTQTDNTFQNPINVQMSQIQQLQ